MGELAARVGGASGLATAWERVLANDTADVTLSAGVARFAADADTQLAALVTELGEGPTGPGR